MEQSEATISISELRAFKIYDSFHLFLFSRTSDGKTVLLLNKEGEKYSNFKGKNPEFVIHSIAKLLLEKTQGLLFSDNQPYLVEGSKELFYLSKLKTEKLEKFNSSVATNEFVSDIFKLALHSPYRFQQKEDNCSYYFLEIPKFDTKRIAEVAKHFKLNLYLEYFTTEEIVANKTGQFDEVLVQMLKPKEKLRAYFDTYIVKKIPIEIQDTFIFIKCSTPENSLWLDTIHSSYFERHGEKWYRYYPATRNDFPTDEILAKASAVLIPGSSFNVTEIDKYHWLKNYLENLSKAIKNHPKLKFLGICFGGQSICHAIGGKVENMNIGYIAKGETFTPSKDFYELPYIKVLGLDPEKPLSIVQFHKEHMSVVPEQMKVYAKSPTANVELFGVGERILGWQGHPDYPHRFLPESKRDVNITQEETLKICYSFLKHSEKSSDSFIAFL